eukprot:UN26744
MYMLCVPRILLLNKQKMYKQIDSYNLNSNKHNILIFILLEN